MKTTRLSTRSRAVSAVVAAIASVSLLAACSSGSPAATTATNASTATPVAGCPAPATISIWAVQTSSSQQAFDDANVAAFEKACPGAKINYTYSNNTNLKQKLVAAMAGGKGPTVFQSFGYGDLKTYVDEGKVENLDTSLQSVDSSWKGKFLASSLVPGTYDGQVYGFPAWGAQPTLLFYNKTVFKKVGIEPPTTLDELDTDIQKLKDAKTIPIALGNKDQFPSGYWMNYLVNRAGGKDVFTDVYDGKSDVWSDPSVTTAAKQLAKLGADDAFGPGADSVGDVDGSANTLLYTGRAGMKLDGTWLYNAIQGADPSFIKDGDLGYVPFPLSDDTADNGVFGNASAIYSVSSAEAGTTAAQRALANAFLTTAVTTKEYAKGQAKIGYVPALKDSADLIPATGIGELNRLAYKTAEGKNEYGVNPLALGAISTIYQGQTAGLVNGSVSPSQFVSTMNAGVTR